MHGSIALLVLSLVLGSDEDTPEWGGFRGNNGCGVAESEQLPDTLNPEESALWRVEIPAGYSSPVVAGDSIYLTASEGAKLLTLSIDRESGEENWRQELPFDGTRVGMNSSAAPSPVTDGEQVYVLFHAIGVVAYTIDGDEVWKKEMDSFAIPHGMSTSPLVHGEKLVVLVDQDTDAHLMALDKTTGKEIWNVERPGVTHSYSTPAIYAPEKGPAQVIVSGAYQISSYSLDTGEKLWWVNGSAWQTKAVPVIVGDVCIVNAYMVPSAEFGMPHLPAWEDALAEHDANGDGKIEPSEWQHDMLQQAWFIFDLDDDGYLGTTDYEYLSSSATATGGLFAVDMTGKGDVTESHVVWRYDDRRGLPDCPSPLAYDGLVYMIKEGGLFTAMDPKSGEVVKQGRVGQPDQYFASPVAAAGKIITASQSGQLAIVEAGAEWKVVSVHDLQEDVWSTPAIAGEHVIVRSQDALYCFQNLSE
jgi:outer membrane protein assembly factor BamB